MSNGVADIFSDKSIGQSIGIKFTEKLIGDATGYTPYPLGVTSAYNPTGTASASSQYSSSYTSSYAFNGSTSNYWQTSSCSTSWLQIDLGVETWVSGFGWLPIEPTYYAKAYNVLGSNDGSTWTTIYSGAQTSSSSYYTVTWNSAKFRYFRWDFTSQNTTYMAVYYIKLIGGAGNEGAITVTGKEYQYVGGPLIDKTYSLISCKAYGNPQVAGYRNAMSNSAEILLVSSNTGIASSSTTLSVSISATAGNKVIAAVTHRSTLTTPSGWTKIYESSEISSTQKLAFFSINVYVSGTVTFSGIQSSSARFIIHLVELSGVISVSHYTAMDYTTGSSTAVTSMTPPSKQLGEKILYAVSASGWDTSSLTDGWLSNPSDMTRITTAISDTTNSPRMATFLDLDGTASVSHTYTPEASSSTMVGAGLLLVGSFLEYISDEVVLDSGKYSIIYDADIPEGSTLVASYSIDSKATWVGGDSNLLLSGSVWIKVSASGAGIYIRSIRIVKADVAEDTILLKTGDQNRFNNVEGALTITYDSTKGRLMGSGGPVLSFSETFTPNELFKKPNPGVADKITSSVTMNNFGFTQVTYKKGYEAEKITVTPSCSIVFTYVGTVNP